MAIEGYLASSFYHSVTAMGVDGVDAFLALLDDVFSKAGWTKNGTNDYNSPTDADGRTMRLIFTKVSTNTYRFEVRNQSNVSIGTRDCYVWSSASGAWVEFFIGQYHFVAETRQGYPTNGETVMAFMLDQTPFAQSSNSRYTVFWGERRTVDSTRYQNWYHYWCMLDLTTANNWVPRIAQPVNDGGNSIFNKTLGGHVIFHPAEFHAQSVAGEYLRWCGRAYQLLIVPAQVWDGDSKIVLPIGDEGETGTFKVLVGPVVYSGGGLAVRCA